MLVAAAVCPHPPLLVPELAGAAAGELDGLREACAVAVDGLRDARPDAVVVVGGADEAADHGPDAAGGLAPWGVDVRTGAGEPVLPLSLTIGRRLLEAGGLAAAAFHAVPFDASRQECAALGRRLADRAGRVAMLVMGDGSARLTEKSPGYLDTRARPYDEEIAGAFARGEAPDLDPAEAAELWVAGRAAFHVLAAAAGTGGPFSGEVLYHDAPYGVGYIVAGLRSRGA
ncbi:hypothetical protein Ppa06_30380 [Planomonospora parontospora subsp. parontospora]|uniref:Uncharacterized protein n=2 Tax=Planomonospora parontospora TaxID=58119 RepID=A0AA37BHN7_9ACTN|nr:hypothetical protein [Planomonospora parontospora]GGK72158.1 hypothetical protein GCM10010126_34470 [Planomonospora parontospora]GII09240.1 hypothetical protein Ppa06_30380 [Planomonospora parontospora subsp. parontospora]